MLSGGLRGDSRYILTLTHISQGCARPVQSRQDQGLEINHHRIVSDFHPNPREQPLKLVMDT